MFRFLALLAVLGLFVFTTSADAAHQTARVSSDAVSSLLDAPIPSVNDPSLVQLAGHCRGGGYGPSYGYGGFGGYGYGGYPAYRPVWGYGGYGGFYGGHHHHHRNHRHHHHGHRHGGFGLYIGF